MKASLERARTQYDLKYGPWLMLSASWYNFIKYGYVPYIIGMAININISCYHLVYVITLAPAQCYHMKWFIQYLWIDWHYNVITTTSTTSSATKATIIIIILNERYSKYDNYVRPFIRHEVRGRFHQHFMRSFYALRSQKHKKLTTWL